MATYGRTLRRGLPRRPGGEPWPPANAAPLESGALAAADSVAPSEPAADVEAPAAVPPPVAVPTQSVATAPAVPSVARVVRRGLPRVGGGEPWPPAFAAAVVAPPAQPEAAERVAAPQEARPADTAGAATVEQTRTAASGTGAALRRGLPRVQSSDPWPPEGFAPRAVIAEAAESPAVTAAEETATEETAAVEIVPAASDVSTPLPFTRTVWQGAAGRVFEAERRAGVMQKTAEPKRYGPCDVSGHR